MNFQDRAESSKGMQMIITGLVHLVDVEGYTPRESFQILEDIKKNIFQSLSALSKGEPYDK